MYRENLGKDETRRERPKSAPYLRLKNIQGTTIVKVWKKKFSKKLFLKFFFEKKYFLGRKMPKKIQRGDPLGTSGCVCFLEKVKTERVGVKFAFCAELQNCKKSGPLRVRLSTEKNKKKKTTHCKSRAFFLKGKGAD